MNTSAADTSRSMARIDEAKLRKPRRRNWFQRHNRWWLEYTLVFDERVPRLLFFFPIFGQMILICAIIERLYKYLRLREWCEKFFLGPDIED